MPTGITSRCANLKVREHAGVKYQLNFVASVTILPSVLHILWRLNAQSILTNATDANYTPKEEIKR